MMRTSFKRFRIECGVALAVAVLIGGLSGHAAEPTPVVLQGLDMLCRPNQPVELRSRLGERISFGLLRPIRGADVSFFMNGDSLGTAQTSREGEAVLRCLTPRAGDYSIEIKFHGGKAYDSGESSFSLFVRDSKASFLVVDLEAIASLDPETSRARPGAALLLRRLVSSAGSTVLYLTSQETSAAEETRQWMASAGLPPGPLFLWDSIAFPLSAQRCKLAFLNRLKKSWTNVEGGIAGRVEDSEVFRTCGIRPILVAPQEPKPLPQGVRWVKNWKAVERVVRAGKQAGPASAR